MDKADNRLIESINIREIHLVCLNSKREPVSPPENATVDITCDPVPFKTKENDIFSILCNFDLKILDSDKDQNVFNVHAEYYITYDITNDFTFEESDGKAIGGSAAFNAWPYFRELVHRLVIDSGLSPLTLPTMTAKKIREMNKKENTKRLD